MLYSCEKCGRLVKVRSKGLCPSCRSKELRESKKENKEKVLHKKKVYRKNTNPELSGFFRIMLDELSEVRMSMTGKPIHFPTVCNVCHILPKRIYKSVATERDNVIFLTDEEHNRFDRLLDEMDFDSLEKEFGAIWMYAVRKILNMNVKEKGRLITEIKERYGSRCVN